MLGVALLGAATNVATGVLPSEWTPYRWVAWPAAATFVLVLIILELTGKRDADKPDRNRPVLARRILIDRVRRYWVQSVLERSLYYEARLELKITAITQRRRHPWDVIAFRSNGTAIEFPPDADIKAMFGELDRTIIILGDPGSGKTTMLLELARGLLDEAEADENNQIPVVLPLSSWAVRRQSIAEWMIEQLETQYSIPRQLAADWVNSEAIIPLFDGLDEVSDNYRDDCAKGIDEYLRAHKLTSSALCCRRAEYNLLRQRPDFYGLLTIQPLTREQVEHYVQGTSPGLAGLRAALTADPGLWDLAVSPLLLSIMALAYSSGQDAISLSKLPDRRQNLYDHYVRTMLHRRSNPRYSPEQSGKYLTVLARGLKATNQTVFTVDVLNYSWGTRWFNSSRRAELAASLVSGLLIYGVGWILLGWQVGIVVGLFSAVIIRLGLACHGYDGLSFISTFTREDSLQPIPTEGVFNNIYNWTIGIGLNLGDEFKDSWWQFLDMLILLISTGVFIGVMQSVRIAIAYTLALSLAILIALGVAFTAVYEAYVNKLLSPVLHEIPSPLLRARTKLALLAAVVAGSVCGVITATLASWAPSPVLPPVRFGTLIGLSVLVLVVALVAGAPIIEQLIMRWKLMRSNDVPWPYIPFLEFMVQCLLLRPVGTGYIFAHRELLEFMARQREMDANRRNKDQN